MPQIPIVSGSQRIEPGTPVAAIGVEGSRMTGNQIAALGKEVFNIGNALDAVARRAKDNEDNLRANSAIVRARLVMLKEKAKQDAESIQFGDSADGVDGIDRYNERINPLLSNIQDGLETPEQKKLFEAGIADDIITYSTKVLASEVSKREKVVPILMEDNLRQRASFVRNSGSMSDMLKNVDLMAAEQEAEILGNTMIPDARKPEEILRTKKQLVLEGTQGLLEQGEAGNTNAWGDARQFMVEKSGQLLTAQEKDKLMGDINSAEYSWYTRERSNDEYNEKLRARESERIAQAKVAEYRQHLLNAGNSDIKRNPILQDIEIDPALDAFPSMREGLVRGSRIFTEQADDRYQLKIIDEVMKTKNYDRLLGKLMRDSGNVVSDDRAIKLQAMVEKMRDYDRENPAIKDLYSKLQGEIRASGTNTMTLDYTTNMYKAETDAQTARALTEFSKWYVRAVGNGSVSAKAMEETAKDIISGMNRVRAVKGGSFAEQDTRSIETIEKLQRQMADDKRAGKFNTPEKREKAKRDAIDLINRKRELKKIEEGKVQLQFPVTSGNEKSYLDK